MMKMQESLFRNLFDSLLTNVNSRIDGVIKDLAELKSSLQFTQKDVKSFNANKAPGHDNVSMKIIHQSFQNIVQPLVTIINTSLSTGVFPESLKIAKVIPVFKADDPTLLVTTGQYQFFQPFLNSLKKSCTTD